MKDQNKQSEKTSFFITNIFFEFQLITITLAGFFKRKETIQT